eukprot:g3894.t1
MFNTNALGVDPGTESFRGRSTPGHSGYVTPGGTRHGPVFKFDVGEPGTPSGAVRIRICQRNNAGAADPFSGSELAYHECMIQYQYLKDLQEGRSCGCAIPASTSVCPTPVTMPGSASPPALATVPGTPVPGAFVQGSGMSGSASLFPPTGIMQQHQPPFGGGVAVGVVGGGAVAAGGMVGVAGGPPQLLSAGGGGSGIMLGGRNVGAPGTNGTMAPAGGPGPAALAPAESGLPAALPDSATPGGSPLAQSSRGRSPGPARGSDHDDHGGAVGFRESTWVFRLQFAW